MFGYIIVLAIAVFCLGFLFGAKCAGLGMLAKAKKHGMTAELATMLDINPVSVDRPLPPRPTLH